MTYDESNGYIYIGAGNGNPPTVITKEEFIDLKTSLAQLDLSAYFTILPPDANENYIIVVNKIDGGPENPSPAYGIPKNRTPKEIEDWINRLKEISKMKERRSNQAAHTTPASAPR